MRGAAGQATGLSASLSPCGGDDGLSVTLRHDIAGNWHQRRLQARRPHLVPMPMPPPLLPPLSPLQGGLSDQLSDQRRRSFVLESASSSGGDSGTGGSRLRDICEEGNSPSAPSAPASGINTVEHGDAAGNGAGSSAQSHAPLVAVAAANDRGSQHQQESPHIDTAVSGRLHDAHGHSDTVCVRESTRDGLHSPFTAQSQRGRASSSLEGPRGGRPYSRMGSGVHESHPGAPAVTDDASSPSSRAAAMGPMGHHAGPWQIVSDETNALSDVQSPTTSLAVCLLHRTTGQLLMWGSFAL